MTLLLMAARIDSAGKFPRHRDKRMVEGGCSALHASMARHSRLADRRRSVGRRPVFPLVIRARREEVVPPSGICFDCFPTYDSHYGPRLAPYDLLRKMAQD